MSIRITNSKVVGNADGGELIKYLEGFCGTSDVSDLPTVNVADGSNFIDSETGDVYFYSEANGEYSALASIGG